MGCSSSRVEASTEERLSPPTADRDAPTPAVTADEDYDPTPDEIDEYATWLGMRRPEDDDLLWIASEGLKAPLPEHWKPCKTQDGGVYYFNFATGESVWDHPCDRYYRKTYEEEKAKKLLERKSEQVSRETAAAAQQAAALNAPRQRAQRDVDALQGAAALPSYPDLGVDEEKLKTWREQGGGALEPGLTYEEKLEKLDKEKLGPPAVELDASTPADTAALPSAADLGVSEEKLELWRERGGGDLEPVLASGAVALLDARWIISHAVRGGRRPHPPPGAAQGGLPLPRRPRRGDHRY